MSHVVDEKAAAVRLAAALRIPTCSLRGSETDDETFFQVHALVRDCFPLVHAHLMREVVNEFSLLYTWPRKDSNRAPVIFLAHLDVVPIEQDTEPAWTHPPFDGVIDDGYIWGRGALDLKSGVFAILEAAESLLAEGFEPPCTLYFAFGHDEEIGGTNGAKAIAELLHSRGVHPACVLDEGSFVLDGLMPGIAEPVSLIGVAEKGYVNVELTVQSPGGHASMPASETAVGILSHAISRLERHPFPARLHPIARAMFGQLARHLPLMQRILFANTWLFKTLIVRALTRTPGMNAELRTTMAPTIFQGSVKENVLAQHARAVVNVRILPGDTVAKVLKRMRQVINDPRVAVRVFGNSQEPSRASPMSGPMYDWVMNAIQASHPNAVVAPYVTVATTDSRYYAPWVDAVYRILPVRIPMEDVASIHGTNERIGIQAYAELIEVMRRLMSSTPNRPLPHPAHAGSRPA